LRSGSFFLEPGVGSGSSGTGVTVGSSVNSTFGFETSSGGRVSANTVPPAITRSSTTPAPRSIFFLAVMGRSRVAAVLNGT
jgi:hypothetical protein